MPIQGVTAVNNGDFERPLDPDAEALAYKLQAYLKTKSGYLAQQIKLNHNQDRYYWCIMSKSFVLINGGSEMYLLPWKKDEKGQLHIYSPHSFAQGAVFLAPESEIVYLGDN